MTKAHINGKNRLIFLLTLVIGIMVLIVASKYAFQRACSRREIHWPDLKIADEWQYKIITEAYKIKNEPNREITITASDGVKLVGHYFERKKNAPIIIFFHGLWSDSYVCGVPIYRITEEHEWNLLQRTRNANGQVIEEFYLDAAGNPVERYGDYYGISYEYNSENVVIRYLGADKQPMMLGAGYSTIVRTLVDGKATDDLYYDLNMQPVQCTGGYYGLHRKYDEQGLNCAITYLDENRQPVICTSGYAVKTYLRDSEGTVIGERYFDAEENPVKSSLTIIGNPIWF